MNLRKAAEQALEALSEYEKSYPAVADAFKPLRTALAEDDPETNFGNMAKVVDLKRDDIIRMARDAEVPVRGHYDEQGLTPQELERFAALVSAAEREACAKVCDFAINSPYVSQIAAAIRSRGNK